MDNPTGPPKRETPPTVCPTCRKPTRLSTLIVDVEHARTVPVFFCDTCRKEIWD